MQTRYDVRMKSAAILFLTTEGFSRLVEVGKGWAVPRGAFIARTRWHCSFADGVTRGEVTMCRFPLE